jgi:hypothetical protein
MKLKARVLMCMEVEYETDITGARACDLDTQIRTHGGEVFRSVKDTIKEKHGVSIDSMGIDRVRIEMLP